MYVLVDVLTLVRQYMVLVTHLPTATQDMFVLLLTLLGAAFPIPQTDQVPPACMAGVACPFPLNDKIQFTNIVRVACLFPLDEWAPLISQVTVRIPLHYVLSPNCMVVTLLMHFPAVGVRIPLRLSLRGYCDFE